MEPETEQDIQPYTRSKRPYADRRGFGQESDGNYKYIKTFHPLRWQIEPWKDTSPVLLLTGAAGGGKTNLALEKLHGFLLRYPKSTGVLLRKSRTSLINSALLYLQKHVIGNDPRVVSRISDYRFDYANGSVLVWGGMKDEEQRERIRGTGQEGGIDIAVMEEAHEFTEEDFSELMGRMRGHAAPWTQVILCTNPDGPGHWINVRLILGGEASVYYSMAKDNLHNPDIYFENLKKLTGVQKARLVEGKWVVGSGLAIDQWGDYYNAKTGSDMGGNVTLDAEYIPDGGPVVWSIDDGYSGKMDQNSRMFTGNSHPRAILMAQRRSDGRLAVFSEDFAIQTLPLDHINGAIRTSAERGWPLPGLIVKDIAAASLSGALIAAGFSEYKIAANRMDVEESIKEMNAWVSTDHNGYRRTIVHPRCFYLRYQMASYNRDSKGKVIKEHDDGPDALRYLVWHLAYGEEYHEVDIATWSTVAGDYGKF